MSATATKCRAEIARANRQWAVIEFEIETKDTPAPHETVDHDPAEQVRELTWMIEVHNGRRADTLEGWDRPATVEEWEQENQLTLTCDRAAVAELIAIGNEWHLNGVVAGCAHQTVEYETDRYGRRVPSLSLTKPCPATGYQYGHAWLCRPLAAGVEERVRDLFAKLPKEDR